MLNEKGMASVEMIPILLLFVILVNFALGFFGAIHSGILNSIAARNYAFETFRNRANLNYLRDEATSDSVYYWNEGFRLHGIIEENRTAGEKWIATKRPIKFTETNTGVEATATADEHNQKVRKIKEDSAVSKIFQGKTKQEGDVGTSPVWIMSQYGICLRASCEAP